VDDKGYKEAKVGSAISNRIYGSYTYKASFRPIGFESRDIGLYQECMGRPICYLRMQVIIRELPEPQEVG
jgi:hypothetical protein